MNALAGDRRPLICHIVFRFDYGGLENGIVNLVNGLPADEFRHAIVALTEVSEFRKRIRRADVEVHALGKRPGKDFGTYLRLLRLLRRLHPAVVHTRNYGTLDCSAVAALARTPVRVHGEHGWDVHDPDGVSRKYLRMRRLFGRFVQRFVTVSTDLERWLVERVGIAKAQVVHICNGVDTDVFVPRRGARLSQPPSGFPPGCVVFGSVTRFSAIKDPLNLVRAFIKARAALVAQNIDARLVMAGDGPLHAEARAMLAEQGCAEASWLPGSRDDVAKLLPDFDVYVLGSLREGISNTILEAMASGLPVIASATGGNLELVQPGVTGALVQPGDTQELARALIDYGRDAGLRARHGAAARERAVATFSLRGMLEAYRQLYLDLTSKHGAST
ncbi:MAG: TIGR03088 family PEP-CTERM/XrtA system glycosyltransferase [Steroidobacteraceae bacterium]